jgi:hypothetical protein
MDWVLEDLNFILAFEACFKTLTRFDLVLHLVNLLGGGLVDFKFQT